MPGRRKRRWKDADDASFYRYMETYYGITGREKLDMGLLIVSGQNRINDVKQYLQGLKWDGVQRVDRLLVDYLGAEDNAYSRAVIRKLLCAAVARAVKGGVKFDYMPILAGPQGIGKSTFLSILGKEWFSDSLTTFEGKEAAELIQGTWINEVGELTAFTKQETQTIKQFLSKTDDIYRAAYGRRTEKYPRRCVFCGTSNDSEFLKDSTGNRRFWPVDVGEHPASEIRVEGPAGGSGPDLGGSLYVVCPGGGALPAKGDRSAGPTATGGTHGVLRKGRNDPGVFGAADPFKLGLGVIAQPENVLGRQPESAGGDCPGAPGKGLRRRNLGGVFQLRYAVYEKIGQRRDQRRACADERLEEEQG